VSDVAETAADCEFVAVTENDPEHVTTVTIDRPDARNALHGPLREELKAVFAAVDESDARVVVLTGSDDAGAFVAGADVSELRERNAVEQRRASERPRVYETVEDVRQPVIARLNGHALGAVSNSRSPATSGSPTSGPNSGAPRSTSASSRAAARPSASRESLGRGRR